MVSTSAFIQALIPLYIMAMVGYAARKLKIFNSQANQIITQLMLYITLPALILYSLNTVFTKSIIIDFLWLLTMSIFIMSLSIVIAARLRQKAKLPTEQKSVYESLIIFGNQGFIGFAIVYILMAEQGVIYLTLFNIFYLILIWSYGIYLFTKGEGSVSWKILVLNPGILSTLTGLVMLFLPYQWPVFLADTFESLGKMTVPLSMLLIGSLLSDLQWYELRQYCRNIYLWIAVCCKLLILPMFLFGFLFFQVPYPLIVVAVLTSAMPSASTISVYAQKFGADANFASFGVLLSTLLCILTIPLLYSLLLWLQPLFYF